MKKHLFIFCCLFFYITGSAQDQLFKKDNSKLQVKVIEMGPEVIKYRLFNNLNGPVYEEKRSNVVLIIFENGKQEVITPASASVADYPAPNYGYKMSKGDSLAYFRHSNNISVNFLNFFNNEVGLMYQKEFYKSQFNIVIPVAIGLEKPSITQDVYFNGNNSNVYNYGAAGNYYTLDHKLYEVGFGINYYPSLSRNTNYYIGPAFRYMQYSGTHHAGFNDPSSGSYVNVSRNSILSRYCVSITNGVIIRTKSRLTVNFFGSLGFKNDHADNPIMNPYTNTEIKTFNTAFSLYFWSGINVGFSF